MEVVWSSSTPRFTDTTTGQLGEVAQRADGLFVFRPDGDTASVPITEPGRFKRVEA